MIWAAQWQSKSSQHIIYEYWVPKLFRTKKECAEYIKNRYGYIAHRKDLRREPHCYRMPKPVKVKVELVIE